MRTRLTLIGLALLAIMTVYAQQSFDLNQVDRTGLETSFSLADRNTDPERWMAEARNGTLAVLARWEADAKALYDTPELFAAAKADLSAWLDNSLAERYRKWLMNRFFGEEATRLRNALKAVTDDANKEYLYKLDTNGNVQYDEAGDPMYYRPADGRNLDADRASWLAFINGAKETLLADFGNYLAGMAPELVQWFKPGDSDAQNEIAEALKLDAGKRLSFELDAVAKQEERYFVARRLSDSWSVRKKSEAETASEYARLIAEETGKACDEAILGLTTRIAAAEAGTGDLSVAGADWLEEFKSQFNRGLAAWERAEQSFMERRLEWEAKSADLWTESNKAWAEALEKITRARETWRQKAMALIREGESAFERAGDELQDRIEDARTEIEQEAETRAQTFADRAAAWVDIYTRSSGMMLSSEEGFGYWQDKAGMTGLLADAHADIMAKAQTAYGGTLARVKSIIESGATFKAETAVVTKASQVVSGKRNEISFIQRQISDTQTAIDRIPDAEPDPENGGHSISAYQSLKLENLKKKLEALLAQKAQKEAELRSAEEAYAAAKSAYEAKQRSYFLIGQALKDNSTGTMTWAELEAFNDNVREGLGDAFLNELNQNDVGSARNILDSVFEVVRWHDFYDKYRAKATEARTTLIGEFGILLGNDTPLKDVLADGAQAGDFCLDEYQLELVRAKAVESYWTKRVSIAQAVATYAADQSSTRETEAETLQYYKDAKTAYETALATYKSASERLAEAGKLVGDSGKAVAEAKAALAKASAELETINKQYADLMTLKVMGGDEYLRDAIAETYRALLASYNLGPAAVSGAKTEGELMADYLAKAGEYSHVEAIVRAGDAARDLIQGGNGAEALRELGKQASLSGSETASYLAKSTLTANLEDYESLKTSAVYDSVEAIVTQYKQDLDAIDALTIPLIQRNNLKNNLTLDYTTLIKTTLETYRMGAEASLERRLEALRLLSASDGASWYKAATGKDLPADTTVGKALEADMAAGRDGAALARLTTAQRVLEACLTPDTIDASDLTALEKTLARRGPRDADASAWINSLTAIKTIFDSTEGAERTAALEALAASDLRAKRFLEGGSPFALGNFDLLAFVPTASGMSEAEERYLLYTQYNSLCPAFASERRDEAYKTMADAIGAATGLSVGDTVPSAKAIAERILAKDDWQGALINLSAAVQKASSLAPGYMQQELGAWFGSLQNLVMAKAYEAGKTSALNSAELTSMLELEQAKAETYQKLMAAQGEQNTITRVELLQELLARDNIGTTSGAYAAAAGLYEATLGEALGAYVAPDWSELAAPDWGSIRGDLVSVILAKHTTLADTDGAVKSADQAFVDRVVDSYLATLKATHAIAQGTLPEALAAGSPEQNYVLEATLASCSEALASGRALAGSLYALQGSRLASDIFSGIKTANLDIELEDLEDYFFNSTANSDLSDLIDHLGADYGAAVLTSAFDAVAEMLEALHDDGLTLDATLDAGISGFATKNSGLLADFAASATSMTEEWTANLGVSGTYAITALAIDVARMGISESLCDEVLGSAFAEYADLAKGYRDDTSIDSLDASFIEQNTSLGAEVRAIAFRGYAHRMGIDAAEDLVARLRAKGYGTTALEREVAAMEDSAGYLGSYSGDPAAWAEAKAGGDSERALRILDELTGGQGEAYTSQQAVRNGLMASFEAMQRLQVKLGASQAWDSFTEYMNDTASGKHWRMYLGSDIVKDEALQKDPDGNAYPFTAAPDKAAGVAADAEYDAEAETERLMAAFTAWSDENETIPENAKYAAFGDAVTAYIDNSQKVYDANLFPGNNTMLAETAQNAYKDFAVMLQKQQALRDEIASRGATLDRFASTDSLDAELSSLRDKLTTAQAAYDAANTASTSAANAFMTTGAAYDTEYKALKTAWSNLEDKRTQFETREAIQRYASTAYLGDGVSTTAPIPTGDVWRTPAQELAYTTTMLTRSTAAKDALLSLYNDSAASRPVTDTEYRAAYENFKTYYSEKLVANKAKLLLASAVAEQEQKTNERYMEWYTALGKVGVLPADYAGLDKDNAINQSLYVDDKGRLRVLRSGTGYTASSDDEKARLASYFTKDTADSLNANFETSDYETYLASWNERMQATLSNAGKLRTFALARAWIIYSTKPNKDDPSIFGDYGKEMLRGAEGASENVFILPFIGEKLDTRLDTYRTGGFVSAMKRAFEGLSDNEKADLEMLLFQSANGGCGNAINALSNETASLEFEQAQAILKVSRSAINDTIAGSLALAAAFWWNPYVSVPALASAAYHGLWSNGTSATIDKVNGKLNANTKYVNGEKARQVALASKTTSARKTLADASTLLATLKGASGSGTVAWGDVSKALVASKKFSAAEISTMRKLYDGYTNEYGDSAGSAQDMIGLITTWSSARYNEAEDSFARRRQELAGERSSAESAYKSVYDKYLAGEATDAELASAAQAAYGNDVISDKAYYIDMRDFYDTNVFTAGIDYTGDSLQTAASYTGLVQSLAAMRYRMEIAARETEWGLMVKDLETKRLTWESAATRIMETGLADFDKGFGKIKTEWTTWQDRYKEEYERLATAWDTSYAEMEAKKLSWVGRATQAAETAADSVTLALLGDDAETEARRQDTNIVAELTLGNNAKSLLAEALASASIMNMEQAMKASAGSAETVAEAVQTGLGGPSAWNSATGSLAAEAFARESNKELAARQAKLMAARLRDQVALMTKGVEESVTDANENVEAGMDSTYLGQGFWSISGSHYVKDVVVHSTVGQKYITERATVERFRAYEAPPVTIKTDLADSTLETLQADAIQQLMANVQKEISDLMEDIFGHRDEKGELKEGEVETIREYAQNPIYEEYEAFEDQWVESADEGGDRRRVRIRVPVLKKRITGYTQGEELWSQEIGAGFFGKYLGAAPVTKTSGANLEEGYTGIFEARTLDGSNPKGEIGRLMAEYIYWSMKEGQGYALAAAPVYDKPLWDSRGSWFQAPSIKDITDIGVTIAATVVTAPMGGIGGALISAGINLADDALFAALDVAGSYKSFAEAGLEFGKKALTSAASIAVGGVFNGGLANEGFFAAGLRGTLTESNKLVGGVILSGLQTWTSSSINGAINGVYIDPETGKLGYDSNSLVEGMFGVGTISSVASSMATSIMGNVFSKASAEDRAFYRGGMALATTAAGEAARYGTTLAYTAMQRLQNGSALDGSIWGDAYDRMGGLNLNVLNLGSMFDLAGTLEATYNSTGQSGLGDIAQKLGGIGLLELSLGRKGITGRLGMGGADVGGSLYSLMKGVYDKSVLTAFKNTDAVAGDLAWKAYVHGDWTAGNTARRLSIGKDSLVLDITQSERYRSASEEDRAKMLAEAKAITESDGSGGRNIYMQDMRNQGFEGDGAMWNMAITLQHEAYRDGKITSDNTAETQRAAKAHTMMALGLLGQDGVGSGFMDQQLYYDMMAMSMGDDVFNEYVNGMYDSSSDFWRLKLVDGKIKFGFERDKLTSFTMDDSILGAAGLSEEQKNLLKSLNGKEFSQFTEAEKTSFAQLVSSVTLAAGSSAEATAANLTNQTANIGAVMDLGLVTRKMINDQVKGINAADYATFGTKVKYLLDNNLLERTAQGDPSLDGLQDLGDGTVRPFKILAGLAITTLPGLRFDPLTGRGDGFGPYLNHVNQVDIGGYSGEAAYYMAFGGSAKFSLGNGGNFMLDMTSSDNVWAYQFMHNAPTALLDMLQAVSYTDTGFAVGADGSITLSGLKKGTQIGQIGRTGGNYGQHIHGEIKKGTTKDFINRFQLGTMWVTPNAKAYSGYSQAIDISTKAGIDEVMRGLGYIASCGTDSLQKGIQLSQFLSYYHLDNSQAVQSLISQYKPGEVPPYLQQYLYYVQLTEYWRAKLGR